MSIQIIKPGLLTTIQDKGRYGYQKEGIIVSGAMDKLALKLANILVGNSANEAGIEITQLGPQIEFRDSQIVAITGGNLSPTANNLPMPMWRPVYIEKGSVVAFGKPIHGYRSYISFAGGLAIPEVLGSGSTYLKAGIGGWHGRPLQSGDRIPFRKKYTSAKGIRFSDTTSNALPAANWTISPSVYPALKQNAVIRVMQGPEYCWFTEASQHLFWQTSYTLSPQSDRMGYQLTGVTLTRKLREEMLSCAVTFGTIQVPAKGNPIILMADHQTTGGYPRIAQVASADFSILAQVPPGSSISFKEVSLREAQEAYITQQQDMAKVIRGVGFKLSAIML